MIARLLRGLWVAAIVLAIGAAWLSVRLFGDRVGAWNAGLAAVIVITALHPAGLALQFALSRAAGDPVPRDRRLTWSQAVRCFGEELVTVVRGVWVGNPFREHRPAPRPAAGPVRDTALLFLHGYFCNRSIWHSFMREAARRGYPCEAITLDDTFASISTHVHAVRAAVDALLETSGARRVAIVAHSMGGLVARHALRADDVDRVVRVFTLGTPHHGTHAARFGRHPSVVEMRRDSRWLAAAVERERAGGGSTSPAYPRHRYTTIYSWHDDIVYPQTTACLEGAECVDVAGVGHVALAYDQRVRSIVFDRLERPDVLQAAAS